MRAKGLQRALLVGLDPPASRVVDLVLAALARAYGPAGIVRGLGLAVGDGSPVPDTTFVEQLTLPGGADLDQLAAVSGRLLRRISQLDHLPHLASQGLTLHHPDEVHLLIIGDVTRPETPSLIKSVVECLSLAVQQQQVGHLSLTGIWLFINPIPAGEPGTTTAQPGPAPEARLAADLKAQIPWDHFDRGCFLAGPTNELGLLVGGASTLEQRAAEFVSLLLQGTIQPEQQWPAAAPLCAAFGLTSLRWPVRALVALESKRWSRALLETLLQPPAGDNTLASQARRAAQQWFAGHALAPPALLSRLAAETPAPPDPPAQVAGLPWPWQVRRAGQHLDATGRVWQASWSARQPQLAEVLAGIETDWSTEAGPWPGAGNPADPTGAVLRVQSRLAAASELLQAFEEGVAQKLAETEEDLAQIEQQLRRAQSALDERVQTLPATPLSLLLRWGWRPLRWSGFWAECRQAQAAAHQLAQLSRAQWLAWHTLWLYEEILACYQRLRGVWEENVERWTALCRTVSGAVQGIEPVNLTRLRDCLVASGGPWPHAEILADLDRELSEQGNQIWTRVGRLPDWLAAGLTAETLALRLQDATSGALQPLLDRDVEAALRHYLPDQSVHEAWLSGLFEQAAPFWWYDETAWGDGGRQQAQRQRWLLLPGGESAALARAAQKLSPPARLIPGPDRQTVTAVTVLALPDYSNL